MISIINVSKTFKGKNDVRAVKNVSLEIKDKEIFGIVGYSGAGKSTLIRLVNQLEKADSGQILIDGVDICELKGEALRKQRQEIGMIFQHFNLLWSKTVLENIMFPLVLKGLPKKEREEEAIKMAKEVGLEDKLDVYPSTLSGGQKQRVAIARALVLNPKILLCDEATSALDPKTTEEILELLKKINKEYGLTILMISHQMETIQKICHKLAVMADGKIVEQGSVDDIFANPTDPLTKELIQTVDTGVDVNKLSIELKDKYPQGHLLRITFSDKTSEKPILYSIALKLNIPINIVSANLKMTQAGSLGVIYIHIEEKKDIGPFLAELELQGLKVEVV